MNIVWCFSSQQVDGFDDLLQRFKANEFKSPMRSTVPLLAYWRLPSPRIRELSGVLGFSISNSVCLDFEYKVPVQSGKGNPSYTDLRLSSGGISVCIEGKFTESRYEDVAKWLQQDKSNREEVLAGWLMLLSKCAGKNLRPSDVKTLPYQLVHRAASAYYSNIEGCWLLYQVFDPDPAKFKMYLEDLRTLAGLLGNNSALKIGLAECCIAKSARWQKLMQLWETGKRDLRKEVLSGLKNGDLLHITLRQVVTL